MKQVKRVLAFIITCIFILSLTSCGLVKGWIDDWIDSKVNRTYTIHFNANGGQGEMEDYIVEKGDDGILPICQFTKEGYECIAWSWDPEGNSFATHIQNITFFLPSDVKDGDTIELYAVWTTPGFTFHVNAMGFLVSAVISNYRGDAKEVIVPAHINGNGDNINLDSGGGVFTICSSVDFFESGAFRDNTNIETLKNVNVRKIYSQVFYGCTSLKTIEFRKNVKISSIGKQAFYNCTALEGVLPTNEMKSIGEEAFYMCTSIDKLVISENMEEIGANAFYGWTEAQTIEFTGHTENVFGEEWLNGCNATIIWAKE